MKFTRNFIIILLAAASIILVSVLLISYVNETLDYFVISLLVVFLVVPLAQRLRRPGKLFTKDEVIEVAARVAPFLMGIGAGWGLRHLFESWYEGRGWIGWIVGLIGVLGVLIGVWILYLARLHGGNPKAIERRKLRICRKVTEKSGISHTALCQSRQV